MVEKIIQMFEDDVWILGKKDVLLQILQTLHELKSANASKLAKILDLHVATATKYLERLHEMGVLERHEKKGKTRLMYTYQIKARKITFEIDIEKLVKKEEKNGEILEFYIDNLKQLLEKAQQALDFLPFSPEEYMINFRDEKKSLKQFLNNGFSMELSISESDEILNSIIKEFENAYGKISTRNLVLSVIGRNIKNNKEFVEKNDIMNLSILKRGRIENEMNKTLSEPLTELGV